MLQPRMLELFAGIGGIGLGLSAALGAVTVAVSEYEPPDAKTGKQKHGDYSATVLARRFPDAPNLGDVTKIDWEQVAREHGSIDIICGGFPCQDISLAGKGAGMGAGTRSGLWSHFADAVRHLRPRIVVVENVAALTARGIDRVCADLAACGMDATWDCIPASSVGAPHRRDRLFLVAYAEGLLGAPVVWHDPHGIARRAATDRGLTFPSEQWPDPLVHSWPTPKASPSGPDFARAGREGSGSDDLATAVARTEMFPTPRASEWKGTGPVGSKSHAHRLEKGYLDATVQQREHDAAPEGAERVPPLNPTFVEWLMGFPQGWTDLDDDTMEPFDVDPWEPGEWFGVPRVLANVDRRVARLHALGNAVVPQAAFHVGQVIARNGLLEGDR